MSYPPPNLLIISELSCFLYIQYFVHFSLLFMALHCIMLFAMRPMIFWVDVIGVEAADRKIKRKKYKDKRLVIFIRAVIEPRFGQLPYFVGAGVSVVQARYNRLKLFRQ